jgi:hypothetical protein
MIETTTTTTELARLGNGAAIHITDAQGILCNRWGTVNGVWKAPRPVAGTRDQATCKRCQKLAQGQKLMGPCDGCGARHEACYSHESQHGQGAIYAVPCPADGITTYVTADQVAYA